MKFDLLIKKLEDTGIKVDKKLEGFFFLIFKAGFEAGKEIKE